MGFQLTWLGFEKTSLDSICKSLDLRRTRHYSPFPTPEAVNAVSVGDWHIVVAEDDRGLYQDNEFLTAISRNHDVLLFVVHEGIMYSHAAFWRGRLRQWSITHDPAVGRGTLDITGPPPPLFTAIYDELKGKQDKVSPGPCSVNYVFDVPVTLCAALTGYRHDRLTGKLGDMEFETLEAAA